MREGPVGSMTADEILSRFPRVRRNGQNDWHVPSPAHDDNTQDPAKFSLHLTVEADRLLIYCFAGCLTRAVLEKLGLPESALFLSGNGHGGPAATERAPTTLSAFAARKQVPQTFLEAEGWTDGHYYCSSLKREATGIAIPYRQRDGSAWRPKYRFSMAPGTGFEWGPPKGRAPIPYGRHHLDEWMEHGELWLLEGESDAVTGWLHRLPCLGIPGNMGVKALEGDDLAGIDLLWIVQEHGRGGVEFAIKVRERLGALRWNATAKLVRLPTKDLSDLHVAGPDGFMAALVDAKALAVDLFAWIAPSDATSEIPADGATTTTPQPFSEGAGRLLAREFPPVEVLIENILTSEGSGFIGGEEKLGKSYFALTEAVSLALGIPMCGRFLVPVRRRVLFIEEEDSPRRTKLRLRAICRGRGFDPDDRAFQEELDSWLHQSVWKGFRLDDPAWLERLDADLTAFPAEVVYLDVLRKLTEGPEQGRPGVGHLRCPGRYPPQAQHGVPHPPPLPEESGPSDGPREPGTRWLLRARRLGGAVGLPRTDRP